MRWKAMTEMRPSADLAQCPSVGSLIPGQRVPLTDMASNRVILRI